MTEADRKRLEEIKINWECYGSCMSHIALDEYIPFLITALQQAWGEVERLRRYHQSGCPCLADDESDVVLSDYMECACGMDALEQDNASLRKQVEELQHTLELGAKCKLNDIEG